MNDNLHVMIYFAKTTIQLFGIWYSCCTLYNLTCYTLLRKLNQTTYISTNVGSIQPHVNYYVKTNYIK